MPTNPSEPRLGSIERVQAAQDRLAKKYGADTPLYAEMEEKYHTTPAGGRTMYWFLWAYTPKGKKVALGPFTTEDEVEQKIAEEGLVEEIIRQYPTIQLAKATQLLKNEVTEQKGEHYRPIDDVIGRTMHQKSLDQAKANERRRRH